MIKDLIEILKQFGISQSILLGLSILTFIVGLTSAIIKLINWRILQNNQALLNKNLDPFFSTDDVDRATRYYIPTKFQNVSTSSDEEPGKEHLTSAKELLMPRFLDKVFKTHRRSTKYYLILADSGMGKTTFLINLFLNYASSPIKNLFSQQLSQDIKLFPLGSPKIWKDIEKIENKKDVILLLDAFDEDIKAVENYNERMKEIIEATVEFKTIIITCRTQFFPTDKEIPDDTGCTTFGGEQDTYKFERMYLSVFDESDIKKYLRKRFSIFQRSKRRKAFGVVKKSPSLVMRPMLLSYINDFVDANQTFKYSYEIYEVLIDKWIERESKKHGIRQKYGSKKKYREMLSKFSQALATNLYEKRKDRGGYFIPKDYFIKDAGELQITDIDSDAMSESEKRSKSLLNRDAEGKYKFSHQSILEYFLAKQLMQATIPVSTFDFKGIRATYMFFNEMLDVFRELGGGFIIPSKSESISFKFLEVSHINNIELIEINNVEGLNPSTLLIFENIKKLIVFDDNRYGLLYSFYVHFFFILKTLLYIPEETNKFIKQIQEWHLDSLHERLLNSTGRDMQPIYLKMEALEKYNIVVGGTQKEKPVSKKLSHASAMDKAFIEGLGRLHYSLEQINDFLEKMSKLKKALPKCKIYY